MSPTTQELPQETQRCSSALAKPSRSLSWRVASNLFVSFRYAWTGLSYAFQTQRNFRIHLFVGTIAIGLSVFLNLSRVEVAIIGLTIGAVLTMELLNTAIESVVDLTVRQTYHELAKIAKDCAAGAVLISAFASVIVACFLLIPPLIERVQTSWF
ncbi:diacylglycerol kinase family protein [Thermocoleostomius sinensis]|jgi:diacylglycerol kinase (ATP)|uniref:Diacylglycerol kinase family protein n=1 Tax=Thermocoleostomius sinensis A174 TaxID=2016057 RepID=A0A9E8ZME9_9CYAN|nr:diacylglycerol kinase family protein [Thermocoleostomius sinensis]WAL61166.1 diacylglycerol kinase family protein [Thermocoleostomius sinensis A174]